MLEPLYRPPNSARTIDHYNPLGLPDCTGRGPGADQTYHTHTYTKHTHIQPSTTSTYYAPRSPVVAGCAARSGRARLNRGTILVLLLRTKQLTHYRRSRALVTHTRTARAPAFHRARGRPLRPLPTHVAHTHTAVAYLLARA